MDPMFKNGATETQKANKFKKKKKYMSSIKLILSYT